MKKSTKTFYGGQALLEGVMMKGKDSCGCAVRNPEGKIVKMLADVPSPAKKVKILGIPFIRGVANFFYMLIFGMKALTFSATVAGEETEEPSKFEIWMSEKLGKSVMDVVIAVAVVLGIGFAMLLFVYLPAQIVSLGSAVLPANTANIWLTLIEGVTKIAIFVIYILLVSKMKEIGDTFRYHGAEHKTINCYEAGEPLNEENVKKYSTYHPRCGTSFIMFVLIVSILVFSLLTWGVLWQRILYKLLLMPVVMGISYEIIRLAGKYDNALVRAISFPGKLMQKLTSKEPDEGQIECAITALKIVLESEEPGKYPEAAEDLLHGFDSVDPADKKDKPAECGGAEGTAD